MLELNAGISRGKAPIDGHLSLVAFVLPGSDLLGILIDHGIAHPSPNWCQIGLLSQRTMMRRL